MNDVPPENSASQQTAGVARISRPVTKPKRHHYLPDFYLKGFSVNGFVAVYDREKDEVRLQTPKETCAIGHFYTMEDDQGRKSFELEKFLAEYEGKAKPVIDKLAAREAIEIEERCNLAIFVALGAMRTPDFVDSLKASYAGMLTEMMKNMIANVDDVEARLCKTLDFAGQSEDEVHAQAQLMVDMVQNNRLQVVTDHRWAVRMAIEAALKVAPIFAGRDWVVVHRDNDKKSFVTTDAPVLLTTVEPRSIAFWGGVGFGNTDAMYFFPLKDSCTLAMCGNGGDMRHVDACTDLVRQINLMVAAECQRFLIGRDEALVRSLAQAAGLATSKWKPKMQSS